MDTITEIYQAKLKALGMDAQGILQLAPPCRGCGKPLNADGDHPAEHYAGTFQGLCTACTQREPFVVKTLPSGLKQWSCPPHCPQWRRDREVFMQAEGCGCDHGREWKIERGVWGTNRYPMQCTRCADKHYGHPVVKAQAAADDQVWRARKGWEARITAEVHHRMKTLGILSTDKAGVDRVFDVVIKEAPPRPADGIPVVWPQHWKT